MRVRYIDLFGIALIENAERKTMDDNKTKKIKDPRDLSSYLKLTPDGEVRLLDDTSNVAISIIIRILATMPKSQRKNVINAVRFVYK